MKYHPIIFNTAMVQSCELGHKTKTRRTKGLEEINKNPNCFIYDGIIEEDDSYCGDHSFELLDLKGTPKERYCPVENKHQVGDILWVRETWQIRDSRNPNIIHYKATDPYTCAPWKPAIHMPKEACRLFLEIKSIRAERLQDISDNDALAEGVYLNYPGVFRDYLKENHAVSGFDSPKESFKSLWISIYKEESWNANPFVWVYEFEKIEKPKGFI